MTIFRYKQWDGTQQLEDLTASDLMKNLADRLFDGDDLLAALRDMLRQGAQFPNGRQMPGLRDLLNRLRDQRKEQLQRYNMDSVMEDIKKQLEEIINKERQTLERRRNDGQQDSQPQSGQQGQQGDQGQQGQPGDPSNQQSGEGQGEGPGESGDKQFRKMLEDMIQRRMDKLDSMPSTAGGRIQQLRDYDFMDQEARDQFNELLESLQKQMMQQYFDGMKQSLGAMTPEMMQQAQQMVRDLNQLLEEHRRGDDSGFDEFMQKWGDFFPKGMESVDDLAHHLAEQMEAMQSLMDSMTPEMRRELDQMIGQLFNNDDFNRDLSELMYNLDQLYPSDRRDRMPFMGDDPVTLQEAMRVMGEMNHLDELEKELMEAVRGNTAEDLNLDNIERLMGDEARKIAEELQQFTKMLEEAGLITRKGKGWDLTARAMKKIGERALEDIFGRIDKGLSGDHTMTRFGWGVERLDDTKQYVFGDPFAVDVQGTVMNAIRRQGAGTPVNITVDDFDVYRDASINQCTTVILLDMSYSMLRNGRFLAGRKVAMALDSLIRTKFPRDVLHIAAFSYFVLPLKSQMLLETNWIDPGGTDFPEAIRGARQMLKNQKDGTRQIILITDGAPHANAYGYDYGRYDRGWSMRQAMEEALREVQRCTKDGIILNTFMLDTEPVMTTFIKTMARLNRGRIFFGDPSQLGEFLLVDYMKNRRARA